MQVLMDGKLYLHTDTPETAFKDIENVLEDLVYNASVVREALSSYVGGDVLCARINGVSPVYDHHYANSVLSKISRYVMCGHINCMEVTDCTDGYMPNFWMIEFSQKSHTWNYVPATLAYKYGSAISLESPNLL